jgi:hypothetical protein
MDSLISLLNLHFAALLIVTVHDVTVPQGIEVLVIVLLQP